MNTGSADELEVNATVAFGDELLLSEVDEATRAIELAIRTGSHRVTKVIIHAEPLSIFLP